MAIQSPRWLLTLLALRVPAAADHRFPDLRQDERVAQVADADVVFRHHL